MKRQIALAVMALFLAQFAHPGRLQGCTTFLVSDPSGSYAMGKVYDWHMTSG